MFGPQPQPSGVASGLLLPWSPSQSPVDPTAVSVVSRPTISASSLRWICNLKFICTKVPDNSLLRALTLYGPRARHRNLYCAGTGLPFGNISLVDQRRTSRAPRRRNLPPAWYRPIDTFGTPGGAQAGAAIEITLPTLTPWAILYVLCLRIAVTEKSKIAENLYRCARKDKSCFDWGSAQFGNGFRYRSRIPISTVRCLLKTVFVFITRPEV